MAPSLGASGTPPQTTAAGTLGRDDGADGAGGGGGGGGGGRGISRSRSFEQRTLVDAIFLPSKKCAGGGAIQRTTHDRMAKPRSRASVTFESVTASF